MTAIAAVAVTAGAAASRGDERDSDDSERGSDPCAHEMVSVTVPGVTALPAAARR